VIGKVLHALNNTYHMDHFVCVTCSQPFPGDKFIEHEVWPLALTALTRSLLAARRLRGRSLFVCVGTTQGKPYCEEHYWEVYAPRCFACQQPIREGVIKCVHSLPSFSPACPWW
jgi:hypothetical protein